MHFPYNTLCLLFVRDYLRIHSSLSHPGWQTGRVQLFKCNHAIIVPINKMIKNESDFNIMMQ